MPGQKGCPYAVPRQNGVPGATMQACPNIILATSRRHILMSLHHLCPLFSCTQPKNTPSRCSDWTDAEAKARNQSANDRRLSSKERTESYRLQPSD